MSTAHHETTARDDNTSTLETMSIENTTACRDKYKKHLTQGIQALDNGNKQTAALHFAVCGAFTAMMGY